MWLNNILTNGYCRFVTPLVISSVAFDFWLADLRCSIWHIFFFFLMLSSDSLSSIFTSSHSLVKFFLRYIYIHIYVHIAKKFTLDPTQNRCIPETWFSRVLWSVWGHLQLRPMFTNAIICWEPPLWLLEGCVAAALVLPYSCWWRMMEMPSGCKSTFFCSWNPEKRGGPLPPLNTVFDHH